MSGWQRGWYVVPYQVMLRDLDSFGHVNNAVYFTLFEHARTELWLRILGKTSPKDINFIVARAECDFRQQLGMEKVDLCVRLGEMRNTSIEFVHEIRKDGGRGVAAAGRVVAVLFDWQTQSKVAISDDLRRRMMAAEEG